MGVTVMFVGRHILNLLFRRMCLAMTGSIRLVAIASKFEGIVLLYWIVHLHTYMLLTLCQIVPPSRTFCAVQSVNFAYDDDMSWKLTVPASK